MDDTDRISARPRAGALVAALFALTLGVLAPSLVVTGSPAWAHNALAEASPDKKATLKKAPTEVKLRFLQKLDPDYTTITVSDADKQKVPSSEPEVKDRTGSIELEGTLANGVYTVAYQVVSADGHTVKGSYEFTVDDPDAPAGTPAGEAPASAAPTSEAPPAAATSAAVAPVADSAPEVEEASGNGTMIGLIVAVVVVLAGLAGFLYVRRRKA